MQTRAGKPSLRPHQSVLIGASIAAVLAWIIPAVHFVVLPLQYLNTYLHELAHAVMAVLSGGDVHHILVFADGSGVTPVKGGSILLVASAGYVGASVMGALIVYFSRTEPLARRTLRVLAVVLALTLLVWVRGDLVGVVSGLVWILGLVLASAFLRGLPLLFFAQFIGIQQCLTSFQSIFTLLQVSAYTRHHSDAMLLQQFTGIPALFWALSWTLLSVVLVYVTLKASWRAR
jgi:hypothetical protein